MAPESPPEVPVGFSLALNSQELAPGQVGEFLVDGVAVAIANVGGEFFAVSNVCPHAGGPVGDGDLRDDVVTCPLHGWSFDVRDGSCAVDPSMALQSYDTVVLRGKVYVRVAT